MSEKPIFPAFRWFVLATLCIATAATAMALIAPAPLMGPIAKTLEVSLGEATAATMGTFNLFVGLSCIIGGWFIDKVGPVRIWLFCLALLIIGLLLVPVVGTTFLGMIVLRAIHGIATGPIMASAAKLSATWFPLHERGIVTGFQGASVGLGVAAGFMVAPGLFMSNNDWAATMAWLSILSFVAVVMTIIVAVGPKAPNEHSVAAPVDVPEGTASDFKRAIKQPATWAAIGCVVWLSWIFQGFNDLVPGYIAIPAPVGLGLGPMAAGKFMGALQITFMIGAILSAFIMEKIFGGKSKPVAVLGFLVIAVLSCAITLPAVTSSESTLLTVLVLIGFFESLVNPVTFAFIAKNYPENITGKLGGLAQGIGIFGGTAGVFAGATALHVTGMYFMSINIVIGIAVIGCFFALWQNPPKGLGAEDQGK